MSAASASPAAEQVVLLDEDGRAVGAEDKATVHHGATPLHLAFSCYVFDAAGAVLVTRRAAHKLSFPGVWTNSVCGHPAPGEDIRDAVHRRARQELGLRLDGLRLALPTFRYRAVAADGLVENELCPVFVATTTSEVEPDTDEVGEFAWVDWSTFRDAVLAGEREVSSWCVEQVRALPVDPLRAPAADDGLLPAAARVPL